jgi:hypothetical protein
MAGAMMFGQQRRLAFFNSLNLQTLAWGEGL